MIQPLVLQPVEILNSMSLLVIAYDFLQSCQLLTDSIQSFTNHCLIGLKANQEKMAYNVHHSLMLVTALNPIDGYMKKLPNL